MTRSVLYTAITRARELLIIVGNEETVAAMTRNDRRQRRLFRSKAPAGGQGMSVLSWLLDLLYPPKCVLCRKLLTGKGRCAALHGQASGV